MRRDLSQPQKWLTDPAIRAAAFQVMNDVWKEDDSQRMASLSLKPLLCYHSTAYYDSSHAEFISLTTLTNPAVLSRIMAALFGGSYRYSDLFNIHSF